MSSVLNRIKENPKILYGFYIFILALSFRVLLINYMNTDRIAPDATGYYHLAYNLSKGDGYLMHEEPYFFREPGYPMFLSLAFFITEGLGYETGTLTFDENFIILNDVPEIKTAKYLQAIIDSFACVLLFLILLNFVKLRYSFIIGLVFALFFHYAFNTTLLLRETLQSFVALAMFFAFIKYLKHNSNVWLILTGVLWGFLNLIFFPNLIFAFTLPIFIWIYKKSFIKAIIPSMIIGIMMLLTVSPWLYRSYSHFPDFRIFKSFGTSLTPEYLNYYSALQNAAYYNLISESDANEIFRRDLVDNVSESERFRKYWNGTIIYKTDSINALIDEPLISKRKTINVIRHAKNIVPPAFSKYFAYNQPILAILLISIIAAFSLFALIGFLLFSKKLFYFNLVLITYLSVFFIIGSESRRMLPIYPFMLTYCMLGIFYFYYAYIKRFQPKKISELLIGNNFEI